MATNGWPTRWAWQTPKPKQPVKPVFSTQVSQAWHHSPFPRPPAAPAVPPIASPAASAPPSQSAAAAPVADPGNPLVDDAQSLAARAQAIFDSGQSRAQIDQAGAYDANDLSTAIQRLQTQQPKDQQASREAANRQGLFYSGALSKNLDDLRASYLQRQGDMQQGFNRRESARQAAINALAQQGVLSNAEIDAALGDRQTARDQAAAEADMLTTDQAAAPDATPAVAAVTATTAAVRKKKAAKPFYSSQVNRAWHRGAF